MIIEMDSRTFSEKEIEIAVNVGDFSTTAKDEYQIVMEDWTIDVELSKMVDVVLRKGVSIEEALKIMTRDENPSVFTEPNYKDYCELIAIGEFCGNYKKDNLPIYKKMIEDYYNQDEFHYMEEFLIHNKSEYGF